MTYAHAPASPLAESIHHAPPALLAPGEVTFYISLDRDLAWSSVRKKVLAQCASFVKTMEAWAVEKQAREYFAHTLNMQSWSDLRRALRSLDEFERAWFDAGYDLKRVGNLVDDLYKDEPVVTFLDLPLELDNPLDRRASLVKQMRHALEMLSYNPKQSWATCVQLKWLDLQHTVLSNVVGKMASTLVGSHWDIPSSMVEQRRDYLRETLKMAPQAITKSCRELHSSLQELNLIQSKTHCWVRASDAAPHVKHAALECSSPRESGTFSLGLALQFLSPDSVLHMSCTEPLKVNAVVARPLHLGMLCRVGWFPKTRITTDAVASLPLSLVKHGWQALTT